MELYREHCSVCHGSDCTGDGPYALRLTPQPANFIAPSAVERRSPTYLFWRNSEGNRVEPFFGRGSAMPPWKHHLSETEIGQIVAFLKTLAEPRE